jgi:hypothetical protein
MEKRFMPRRLHHPIPLVWNLTAGEFIVLVVTFAFFAFFIIGAGTPSSLLLMVLLAGASVGGEYLFFQIMKGTERSLFKHLLERAKYRLKAPIRYAGR